ncbi:hypothetical protein KP509_1Z236600 [Ceratopteris richardii]|nr:hypothetical protein KP509_1Z236600 [Ceratopteris richardii]
MKDRSRDAEVLTTDRPLRDMTNLEWCLQYVEENNVVLLVFAGAYGRGKITTTQGFQYGLVYKLDYEDEDSDNLLFLVETLKGLRNVICKMDFLCPECCVPAGFAKICRDSVNLIKDLMPWIQGNIMPTQQKITTPVKARGKQSVQKKFHKKKKRIAKEESSDSSSSSEDIIVAPGGELASGVLGTEQNKMREDIARRKVVKKGQLFHLPIIIIHRPPIDPVTGRRPLEIREPHNLHVQNLKKKMKINPHATVVPFLVMVDPTECSSVEEFNEGLFEDYTYYVIGGSHSAEARRQLVKEHPTTFFFTYAKCKIYAGLTTEEAKLLAWDHNNDNDYRQKMSSIERIRFFHHEYEDCLVKEAGRIHPNLRKQCLIEVGIALDENRKSNALRKYDPWFQLAFRSGEIWDLQDKIFTMWENKEVKGQKQRKSRPDPQVDLKGKGRKVDLSIEEACEDMKLTPWRALQGIKDDTLIISTLLRVISKELSLEEMVTELNNHKVYMKIQEVMMKRLGCFSWTEVQEDYPTTSSYKALSEYFILFRDYKPKKSKSAKLLDDCPPAFLAHIERARHEKSRLKAKEMDFDDETDLKCFSNPPRPP